MKKLVVAVLLLLAVLGIWHLASGERGQGAAPPADDAPAAPDAVTPRAGPPGEGTPTRTRARIRREPTVEPGSAIEETPEPAGEPAATPQTVEELLAVRVPSFSLQSEPLKRALGLLSGMTRVPVHLDAEIAADLDDVPLTLEMADVDARAIFHVMGMVGGGLTMAVEEDRIVLHGRGAAWKPEMATVKIEPILPDPNAPTTFTVTGQVLDSEGRSVADAAILSGPTHEVARSDESGSYSFESKQRALQLRAARPMQARSARFNLKAEFGETVEHDFVLGPPAGALTLTVRSTSGEAPKGARVVISWEVLKPTRHRDSATLLVDGTGIVRCDFVPEGDATVHVSEKNHAPATEIVAIRAGIETEHEVELSQVSLADRLRDERVSFAFQGSSLREVVSFLAHGKGIDIIISPTLRDAAAETTITMKVQDASLQSVLDDLCATVENATYEVQGTYVLIKPKPRGE